jgi:hypothetical protein
MLNTLQRLTRLGKYITVTAASCAIKYTVELWVPGLDLDPPTQSRHADVTDGVDRDSFHLFLGS